MTGNPSNRSPDKTARRALRTSQERYRLVVKLIRVVNSTLDLRTVFRHAARGVRALYGCDRASLVLSYGAGFAADYATGTCKEHVEPPVLATSKRHYQDIVARSALAQRNGTGPVEPPTDSGPTDTKEDPKDVLPFVPT